MGSPAARILDPTMHGGRIIMGKTNVWIGGMMRFAARIMDPHLCPPGHWGGPILPPCAWNVLIGSRPAARVGDKVLCACPANPDMIAMGELTVHIGTAGGKIAGLDVTLLPNGDIRVGNNITISGDWAFKATVLGDLGRLSATPVGAALIANLDGHGKPVNIKYGAADQATYHSNTANINADGTANTGSGTDIEYNPDDNGTPGEDWEQQFPAPVALGHELSHADQNAMGIRDPTPLPNGDAPDPTQPDGIQRYRGNEVRTVGDLGADAPFTENETRVQWDPPLPRRCHY